jgi:hypothetical protein
VKVAASSDRDGNALSSNSAYDDLASFL